MLTVNQFSGFGAVGDGVVSTWNPADKDADVALSNGDRDANVVAAAAGSVRGTLGRSTGKYYFEITIIGSSIAYSGLADGSFSLATYVGNSANSASQNNSANTVTGWTKAQTGTFTVANGNVLGFAVDITLGRMWVAKTNSWQLTGDPATNANPWVTGISGLVYPAVGAIGLTNEGGRLSSKTSELTYTPPSGFLAWGG